MTSLRGRLLAQFAIVVLLSVVLVWVSAFWTTRNTLSNYVLQQHRKRALALSLILGRYYEFQGSFQGVDVILSSYAGFRPRRGMGMGPGHPPDDSFSPGGQGASGERIVLFDARGNLIWDSSPEKEPLDENLKKNAVDVIASDQKVGEVLVTSQAATVLGQMEEDFMGRIKEGLTISGLLSLGAAILLAHSMSKRITVPLEKMAEVAKRVSGGKLGEKVHIDRAEYPFEIQSLAEALNTMSKDLAESEEKKREMLRDISHEIRTPLTILSGNLEAISEGVSTLDDETLKTMREEVKRLSDLTSSIQELDDLSTTRRFNLKVLSPKSLVERAFLGTQGAAMQKGISLETKVEEGLPLVLGDQDRVQEVFSNLLSNALRYTSSGGVIRIEAESQVDEEKKGPKVVFRVRDSGPGISHEDLPKVFQRFFRGDPSRSRTTGGSGLGLAITKELVEAMGGSIFVESPKGGGTLFSFTLPAAEKTPGKEIRKSAANGQHTG